MIAPRHASILRATIGPFMAVMLAACMPFQANRHCPLNPPETFAPGVISGEDKDAFGSFSPDGKEFYFTRLSIGRDRSSILLSRKTDTGWSSPEVVPFSGKYKDREPSVSPDGQQLFFSSDRPHPEKGDPSYDLWVVQRNRNGEWGEPQRLPGTINSEAAEYSPILTNGGNLYYVSGRPGAIGSLDIYRVKLDRDGKYMTPEHLGPEINTLNSEEGLYVTPDERLMLIARDQRGRFTHAARPDIYLSVNRRGRWSPPVPIGSPVNSERDEFGPTLSPDGRRLYFTRDHVSNYMTDLGATMDIYSIDSCLISAIPGVRKTLSRMGK